MHRFVIVGVLSLLVAGLTFADVVLFKDGSEMEVQSYEVKGGLVLITMPNGQLRSVPATYVNLEATKRANRGGAPPASSPPPAPTTPPVFKPPPPPAPAAEEPRAPVPPVSDPVEEEAKEVTPPPVPPSAVPPPVWTDEELDVSLVIPSSGWSVETQTASFDVAVRLDHSQNRARATLALVRKKIRDYDDFLEVIRDTETSIANSPSYQPVSSGLLTLPPYTAYEFRFRKDAGGESYYHRMVVYYSRDLAYVLSLSCPDAGLASCEEDFEALVRGLVIKKVRKDITPKGAPTG
jgi:hypothetical protein